MSENKFTDEDIKKVNPAKTYSITLMPVSYTHLRAHETVLDIVCRILLEKKKKTPSHTIN